MPETRKSKIVVQRRPDAPSIPAQAQAYGYEETEDGILKKQEPPSKDDSMGPAFYQKVRNIIESQEQTLKLVSFQRNFHRPTRTEAATLPDTRAGSRTNPNWDLGPASTTLTTRKSMLWRT